MATFCWADFAEKLAILGWRQKDFASRSGVALSTVSAWNVRDSVPPLAMALVDEWAEKAVRARADAEALAPEPNRPRGKPFGAGGKHEVWERSAADHRQTVVPDDYVERLERQEEDDMNQDDGSYGRG